MKLLEKYKLLECSDILSFAERICYLVWTKKISLVLSDPIANSRIVCPIDCLSHQRQRRLIIFHKSSNEKMHSLIYLITSLFQVIE